MTKRTLVSLRVSTMADLIAGRIRPGIRKTEVKDVATPRKRMKNDRRVQPPARIPADGPYRSR